MFSPNEIIFSATTDCNLHCPHCFVNRKSICLKSDIAINFLNSYLNNTSTFKNAQIQKIGFSGGEPFLYLDFILDLVKFGIEKDFMFDQIMTNGDWWKDESDLQETLQKLYDAKYDGKIGLSWDSFHNQKTERMITFIKSVQDLFGQDSLNIQIVENDKKTEKTEEIISILDTRFPEVLYYILPQTFISSDQRAWQGRHWFKDDYCEGPGQILFVHPDGNIAPCCGFANENPQLFIGNINQSFEEVMNQAASNKMIKICYETGLGKYKKELKKQLSKKGNKYPGKCNDICSFCDFVCKNSDINS